MMQPEAAYSGQQSSSDDDWSVVDEPETHLNKVEGMAYLVVLTII